MQRWEYAFHVAHLISLGKLLKVSAENIILNKNDEGKSSADIISEYGQQGWELVDATAISTTSKDFSHCEVLFTFKRPLDDE